MEYYTKYESDSGYRDLSTEKNLMGLYHSMTY